MQEEKRSLEERHRAIAALIRSSQEGDLQAFGELIVLYREKAYGVALSLLNNHHDAEDISQEAFIKAFENLKSFEPSGSFGAWLFKIVSNLAKNKLRWRRIRERFTISLDDSKEDDEGDLLKLQVADPDKKVEPAFYADQSSESSMLMESIGKLPERQRRAVELKFVQGCKLSEVAEMMEIAEGTVKSHIFRALETLKNIVDSGDEPNEM